jgi:ABC-type Na+ efflux pump permease subunit
LSKRRRIAVRELVSLRREKTIALALLVQLFVAAFSSFLVVGLVAMYEPGSAAGEVTVEVGVSGNASDDLVEAVEGDGRRAVEFSSRDAATNAFRSGEVDAVLHGTTYPDGRVVVDAAVPDGEFRTTIVVVQVKEALAALERQRRVELAHRLDATPISLPPDVEASAYLGFTYGVLVPVLAFLPVFISGSVAVDSISEEIERGTLELLRVAPVSLPEILDGKALAAAALAPAQTALWLALLAGNGVTIAHPVAIVALVAALGTLAVAAGGGLALAVGERRDAQLLYSFGVLVAFGAAALLPEDPANAVAKLAIGSPTTATSGLVVASVVLAALGYAGTRSMVSRAET